MTIRQRLHKQLKDRDWFAVSVELVVLVVGVFLGIQVSNWNDARKDRADEAEFLRQLHVDILLAEDLSSRIGDYRQARRAGVFSAMDVLFGDSERKTLTKEECQALYSAGFINMPFIDIGSFNELASAGRIGIIRDATLRAGLLRLQQVIAQSNRTVETLTIVAFPLASEFPDLVRLEAKLDDSGRRAEVRGIPTCDSAGMLASPRFLNMAAQNIDLNDAFFRDGFEPWQAAIIAVHDRVDTLLDISHIEGD